MTFKMIVEWSLGSLERFDWDGEKLIPRDPPWPAEWGVTPVNYGMIEGYINPADAMELDAIWAGSEPIAVGTWLEGEVLGMIWLNDFDHKIILGNLGDLERLDYAGLEAWFGWREPRFTGAAEAQQFIRNLNVNDGY